MVGKRTVLRGGRIVLPTGIVEGDIVINPPFIERVGGTYAPQPTDDVVDVTGAYVMAGAIDTHVHFREPGLTHKATIATESRAAAAGGVTSVCEMPNCLPTTTTNDALVQKQVIAASDSVVNYAFFIGATEDNIDVLRNVDYHKVPGIKVFMGSSTGGMLLDNEQRLRSVFSLTKSLPVVTHCEDTAIINRNALHYGDSNDISLHAKIRSTEACVASTELALRLAGECGTKLHVAHISTKEELDMIANSGNSAVSFEICLPHLLFYDDDYATLGTRIKCNPAVKTIEDRASLRAALAKYPNVTVATDHAPHLLNEKQGGGCLTAPSGMPMVQFSLCAMLDLATEGVLAIEQVSELMSLRPARLFDIDRRGELKPGNYADIAVVRRHPRVVSDSDVLSLCGWTPLAGREMAHYVEATYINGTKVWNGKQICNDTPAMPLYFNHTL